MHVNKNINFIDALMDISIIMHWIVLFVHINVIHARVHQQIVCHVQVLRDKHGLRIVLVCNFDNIFIIL